MERSSTLRLVLLVVAILSAQFLCAQSVPTEHAFRSDWGQTPDRDWIGPAFWANRLQDWRVRNGRVECIARGPRLAHRTLHLLTHPLLAEGGTLDSTVALGLMDGPDTVPEDAVAGLRLGVGGGEMDWRAAAIVHHWPGRGAGLFLGVRPGGWAFIRDFASPGGREIKGSMMPPDKRAHWRLRLSARSDGIGVMKLRWQSETPEGFPLSVVETSVPEARLTGGVALVAHPGSRAEGRRGARWWFDDWQLSGERLGHEPSRTFGPIASTQYTVSRGVLKLTAQLLPVGVEDDARVGLEVRREGRWEAVATAPIERPSFTATFRVADWVADRDTPFRVTHRLKRGDGLEAKSWTGTVRRDPTDKNVIVVAGFTGNHNNSHAIGGGGGGAKRRKNDWVSGMWFPHQDLTTRVAEHRPDLLFFSGDQIYEGKSPSFADIGQIKRDYLYKWYLWCWAWRDLTRDIPCVVIPDDHDVYQGNVWGEGGRKAKKDTHGGYVRPADFVKMVERTQTSHLPDPFDPTPIEQGIGVYYTSLSWGRISFAVLEDRKFKSGCGGDRLPPTGTRRDDHINDPGFDVTRADVAGLKLLGDRQLAFLDAWVRDWEGADLKMALSQTVFGNMATHHGAGLQRLRADLDSNGWPQSGRNRALRSLRRGFVFHLSGDQHLATIVHHGVDTWRDAIWSFCVPSVANFYPRAWMPEAVGSNRPTGTPPWMGDHRDGLLNHVTVWAATNPGIETGREPADLHDKMAGYGIVKLDKDARTITMECWPRYANPKWDTQYPGWPRTITQRDNYAREPVAQLQGISVRGMGDPVVEVWREAGPEAELVYALRIKGTVFHPWVFDANATYTLHIGAPGTPRIKTLENQKPTLVSPGSLIEIDLQ